MSRKKKHQPEKGKFKSHFELEASEKLGADNYEVAELTYIVPAEKHTYTPDFTTIAHDGHQVHFETKGRFRSKAEADKYIYVRDSNPGIDIRFVIMSDKTMMPRSKKTTMYEWLKKNGFQVYVWPNLPNINKL